VEKDLDGQDSDRQGFALPNFSLARSVSVYELTDTVRPSCLSSAARRQAGSQKGCSYSPMSSPAPMRRHTPATLPPGGIKSDPRAHHDLSVGCFGTTSSSCAVHSRHYSAKLRLRNPNAMRGSRHFEDSSLGPGQLSNQRFNATWIRRDLLASTFSLTLWLPACKTVPSLQPPRLGGDHPMASRRDFFRLVLQLWRCRFRREPD